MSKSDDRVLDHSERLWGSSRPASTRVPDAGIAAPETTETETADPLPETGHYQAFKAVDRNVFGLKLYTGGPADVHAAYQYYQFMTDDRRGKIFDIVFAFFVVRVKGRNLAAARHAIESKKCVFLQQYEARAGWPEPGKGDPVIEKIEIVFQPAARTAMLEKS